MRGESEHRTPEQFHNRVRLVEHALIRRRAAQNRHSLGSEYVIPERTPAPANSGMAGMA